MPAIARAFLRDDHAPRRCTDRFARMDVDGFDVWQRLRVPMKAPADAHYGRIMLIGSSSGADVGFNLIGMH